MQKNHKNILAAFNVAVALVSCFFLAGFIMRGIDA